MIATALQGYVQCKLHVQIELHNIQWVVLNRLESNWHECASSRLALLPDALYSVQIAKVLVQAASCMFILS